MDVRILGPLEVAHGDRLVDLGGPRPRLLLAALVIEANRVVSADRLSDVLWGEHAPRRASAGLQVLVSNLRRVLEPDRPARSAPQVLVTRPPGYMVVLDAAALDAARFEALLAGAQQDLAAGHPAAARTALDQALGLWRGRALAEFASEDFARTEANRLEELRTVALEDRVQAHLDLGRHAVAVAEAERLVGEHPLRERLWGQLMLGYYRAGRQADALRAFQQARRHLGEELGIDPGPALQRLEAEVLAQAPSLDWQPPGDEAAVPGEVRGRPVRHRRGARGKMASFVGRTRERERLGDVLDDALAGHGSLVLVAGEPGVGKTTLVEELVDEARQAGALVCWGRCHPGESAPPFWPWTQVVRELASAVPPDEASPAEEAAMAQIVPDLKIAATGGGELPADAAHARFRLCQDLTGYILRAAATYGVVIALDDLHWADPPSIELLTILARRLDQAPVLVMGTYRDVDVAEDTHPWAQAMGILARQTSLERIRLEGLSEEEAGQLIAAATGTDPPPELARAVHARTDGNPFFMTELVRLIASEGTLAGDPEAALRSPVPLSVRDVITQRIAQLSPLAKTVLAVGAVAGREFDARLLDLAADGGEDSGEDAGDDPVLAAIELALARGILTEVPEAVGRYRFSHALIRETIYESASGLRRARLHARVAQALEQLATEDDDHVAELAHHFWHAVPVTGAEPAFRYAVAAADAAGAHLAYERAEEQLRRALELVGSLPQSERTTAELRVLARLGTQLAATRGQASPDVEETFARAAALCRQLEGGRDAITALWGLFYASYVRGELDAARVVAAELLASSETGPSDETAMAGQLAMGISSFHEGRLDEARAHLELSTGIADDLADASLATVFQVDPRVYARCFSSLVLAMLGREEEAGTVASAARRLAADLSHPFSRATAAMFGAWLGFLCDDPQAAAVHAAETVASATEHGFPLLASIGAAFGGWALARSGEPGAGAAQVATGLAPFRAGGTLRQPLFVALDADVALRDGRPDEALASLDEALARAVPSNHYFAAALHLLRADVLLSTYPERSDEAEDALRAARSIAAAQGARLLERRVAAVAEAHAVSRL